MTRVLPLILICLTCVTLGQICFRAGARSPSSSGESAGEDDGLLATAMRPLILLGVVFFAVHLATWMLVLNRVDLGKAYPLMSLDYVMVTLGSATILGERVQRRRWLGVACIVVGAVLIGGN
ncbi:MAG: EamA family transporter [Candidatus Riflebacteria bacterium]|nr:EamA family transporter [Candidatus Riflebacteria bacterium]